MPGQGTWRISTAYDYVDKLDAPDLAWEFLRRNSEYQHDYAQLKGDGLNDQEAAAALSDKWGLSFRGRPRPASTRRERSMDGEGGPMDCGSPDGRFRFACRGK
ncbi:MAG: hypothetical protein KGI75_08930 [Rhizobiaceae bacterium]|nr:hypothetical protein [Rhizobiaceae bacterium]